MNTYDIGDLVEMVATFTDPVTGTAVDPAEVVCTVRDPDGETTIVEASGSDGVYVAEFAPAMAGYHTFAFDGTGGHQAAGERRFNVRRQTVPR